MSPLRWLSVCCFVVCGWCAGDSFHQQAQAHLEALRKTLDLLETLHQEISFRRSDLNLLCRKLIQDGQLPPETVSLQTLEPFPSLTLEERTRFSVRRTHPLLRMFFRPGAVGSGAGVQTAGIASGTISGSLAER